MKPRPPDIEAAAVTYLSALLTGIIVGTDRPAGTDWQTLAGAVVRLQVVDGSAARSLVLDDSILAVEVWHPDSVTAAATAATVCGHLDDWSGLTGGVLVYKASASRPRSLPDPLLRIPRYLLTVQVTARRI